MCAPGVKTTVTVQTHGGAGPRNRKRHEPHCVLVYPYPRSLYIDLDDGSTVNNKKADVRLRLNKTWKVKRLNSGSPGCEICLVTL